MRVTTVLRRLLGVTQMYVRAVEMPADGPFDRVGGAVVAAFPVRRGREAGVAV